MLLDRFPPLKRLLQRHPRVYRSAKTAESVMWLLFLTWPVGLVGWGLVLIPFAVAYAVTSSFLWAFGVGLLAPKLISTGVFALAYLMSKPKPP